MAEQAAATPAAEPAAQPGASPAPNNGGAAPAADPKGAPTEPQSVPLGTFKDLERKFQAEKKEADAFRAQQKEAADKAAQAAGDVAKTQAVRDALQSKVDRYEQTLTAQIDEAAKGLSEDDAKILALLPADDLAGRWKAVQMLAAKKQPAPAVGIKGGGPVGEPAGDIPDDIQTRGQYQAWWARISGPKATPAERKLAVERGLEISKQARKRGLA